jgi:hypothetical protein
LRNQEIAQPLVARQAADVGGEDSIAAEDHLLLRSIMAGLVPAIHVFLGGV